MSLLTSPRFPTILLLALLPSCSGSTSDGGGSASGGAAPQGGSFATGGASLASGGSSAGGASLASGGSSAGGAFVASGGTATATGGAGVTVATGGTVAVATGGTVAVATGGTVAVATGGSAPSSGGAPATGGTIGSTGGTPATGGTASGGSAPATGGTGPATGGSSTAGGNVANYDCGLPAAGASGVPQPSGSAGNLRVLDWAGFQGAVSYTFDDANSSQIEHYSELQALGVPMTFYLISSKAESKNSIWAQALADGHELGNHSETHPQTGTASELDNASAFLQSTFGVTAWTMAAPYGDASYVSLAESRFLINRGVSNAIISPNDGTNPFNLPCYIPAENASASAFNEQIDSAAQAGGWRVVLVHGFTGGTDYAYQPVSITEFVSSVNHAKSLGTLWLDSVVSVGAYYRAQKVVSTSSPQASGSGTQYSWTLPDHFPPGHCLRITVDGGTLSQGGLTLPWDSHGYYELSLDAGSVTLSP